MLLQYLLDEGRILAIDPALLKIVRSATRKYKILSVVITDLRRFYIEPRIVDPVDPELLLTAV